MNEFRKWNETTHYKSVTICLTQTPVGEGRQWECIWKIIGEYILRPRTSNWVRFTSNALKETVIAISNFSWPLGSVILMTTIWPGFWTTEFFVLYTRTPGYFNAHFVRNWTDSYQFLLFHPWYIAYFIFFIDNFFPILVHLKQLINQISRARCKYLWRWIGMKHSQIPCVYVLMTLKEYCVVLVKKG